MLALHLVRQLEDDGERVVAVRGAHAPNEEVHRLLHALALEQPLVVGRLPRFTDQRALVEPLDEDPALVVEGEVGRADHALAALGAKPLLGRAEQRVRCLGVVLELEEAEPAPLRLVEVVVGMVDMRAYAAHGVRSRAVRAGAPREEVLRLAVAEERVHAAVEEEPTLDLERGHPLGMVSMQAERQVDEVPQVAPGPIPLLPQRPRARAPYRTPTAPQQPRRHAEHCHRPGRLREGPRARPRRGPRGRARGGRAAVLPRNHLTSAGGRRDGGRRTDHARLEQLPRPHRRRTRDRGGASARCAITGRASRVRGC